MMIFAGEKGIGLVAVLPILSLADFKKTGMIAVLPIRGLADSEEDKIDEVRLEIC